MVCLTSLAVAQDPEEQPATAPTEEAAPTDEEEAALERAAEKAAKRESARQAGATKERAAAKGEKHKTLTTSRGRTYKEVVIKGVDEVGVKIFHQAGTARIKFAELPEEFQKRFGYDPARADEFLEKERAVAEARDRASIAALRAQAGLPPVTASTRPKTTRPNTTKPKTTGPKVTRPKTTTPEEDPTDAPVASADVKALNAAIAAKEREIAKIQPVAEGFAEEAKKIKDKAFENLGKTAGDPKVNQVALAKADKIEDKADLEFDKISVLRREITKLRREIKKIQRK